ncbi:hypothetical protein [Marinobacterium mangrovicola]|uniref:Uncharacterized protein n=1 Tax=Marinobacterium mangrovicola TaxID=1476959 RepID=A0A4R1G4J5_9GAMM|nr:hypothetical protein [Marinobacterium mangrovicola]TCK02594.1 hypothetical protein CLV83_4290 [Marinobacterium mangrovicola]
MKNLISIQAFLILATLCYLLVSSSIYGFLFTLTSVVSLFTNSREGIDRSVLLITLIYWAGIYSLIKFTMLTYRHCINETINVRKYSLSLVIGALLTLALLYKISVSGFAPFEQVLLFGLALWPMLCAIQILVYNRKLSSSAEATVR